METMGNRPDLKSASSLYLLAYDRRIVQKRKGEEKSEEHHVMIVVPVVGQDNLLHLTVYL